MGMGFKSAIGAVVVLVASSAVVPTAVKAQEVVELEPVTFTVIPIPEVVEEVFFDDSGTFAENRSITRQLDTIFGPGLDEFPEMEIEQDAAALHDLYEELLALQVSTDPILRVPDLPNPYGTSLLLLPTSTLGTRAVGPELRLERETRLEQQPVVVPANPPALW